MTKAYVFPRIIAYIVDMLLIVIISGLLSNVLPDNKNIKVLSGELNTLQTEFLEHKIDEEEFLDRGKVLTYESDYANSGGIIIQVIVIMLYFIVFQFYNNGQTFGKKLMGIKVVNSDGGNLTFNSMVFRSLIVNSILVSFINLCCLGFMTSDTYYFLSAATQMVNAIILMSIILMVLFKKNGRGIHDIVSGTQVVMVK